MSRHGGRVSIDARQDMVSCSWSLFDLSTQMVYYIMKGVSTLFPSTTLKLDVSLVVKEMIIVTRAKDLTYYDTVIRCV